MPERPAGQRSRWHTAGCLVARVLPWVVFGVSLLWTTAFGYHFIFSRFAWYDDEGYVLLSVEQFLQGKPLYDAVYSQYGPFYYLTRQGLSAVLPGLLSHDVTRLVTLGTWLVIAALCALFVFRVTRSTPAALVTYLQGFLHLRALANEPGHPQELAILLIVTIVTLSAFWTDRRRAPWLAVASGVTVACLALTKVNLGAYLALSLLLASQSFATGAFWRTAQLLVLLACVTLPWAVMHAHLGAWAWRYAALVSLWVGALGVASFTLRSERPPAGRWFVLGGSGMLVAGAAICAGVVGQGTSPGALLDAVLIRPASFATVFSTPVRIAGQALVGAFVSLLLAAGYLVSSRAASPDGMRLRWLFWWLKLGGGVVGLAAAMSGASGAMGIGPMLLWLVLARPVGRPWSSAQWLPRAVLASAAALQTLQAYPVAESQLAWATYLLIPAMVVCVLDALDELEAVREVPAVVLRTRTWRIVEAAALVAVLLAYRPHLGGGGEAARYAAAITLSLPGAERIRLPADEAARYYWLTGNVRAHCTTVVTLPGLNSLYLWSGLAPPTGRNTTAWQLLLSRGEQQEIVDQVSRHDAACVVEYEAGVRTGGRGQAIEGDPLVRFLRMNFRTIWELDGYRFGILRSRAASSLPNYLIYGIQRFQERGAAVGIPRKFLTGAEPAAYSVWIQTDAPGVVLGCQSTPTRTGVPMAWVPVIYVGLDGRLRGQVNADRNTVLTSRRAVTDGRWHHVALVRETDRQVLWLDGVAVGSLARPAGLGGADYCQAGAGYTATWPAGNGGWLDFKGAIRDFVHWDGDGSTARIVADLP